MLVGETVCIFKAVEGEETNLIKQLRKDGLNIKATRSINVGPVRGVRMSNFRSLTMISMT